jgi:hypothetical protein
MGANVNSCCGGPSADEREQSNFDLKYDGKSEKEGEGQGRLRLSNKKSSYLVEPIKMPSGMKVDISTRNDNDDFAGDTLKPQQNPSLLHYDEDVGRPRNSHILSEVSLGRNSVLVETAFVDTPNMGSNYKLDTRT